MIKKYFSLLLAFICTASCALAQELNVDISSVGSTVTVSGVSEAGDTVSVFVSKTARADSYGDIVYVSEAVCDESGTFSATFHMPDYENKELETSGTYTAYASGAAAERKSDTLNYISRKKREALVDVINTKTSSAEVKELLLSGSNSDTLAAIGIIGYANYPSSQDFVAGAIADALPVSDEAKLLEVYNNAFVTSIINNAADTNTLDNIIKTDAANAVILTVDGKNLAEDEKIYNFVLAYIANNKPHKNLDDINANVRDGYILYLLNNSNKSSMTDIVTKYADEADISSNTRYSAYETDSTMQLIVNENTILALPSGGAKTLSEFVSIFTDKLTSYTTPGSNSGGTTGGGGGGNRGGGASIGGAVTPAVVPQNTKADIFSDLDNTHWAKEAVEYLYNKGIVSGMGDGSFAPDITVTREQFTKMVVELANISNTADITFDDVPEGAWYHSYISRGISAGLVNGISENLFGTGNPITREDAAVIINRCMKLLGINAEPIREYDGFTDEALISDYAADSVISLYKTGIINGMGDGSFAPKASLSRAQAAKMIYELCRNGGI